MQFTHQTIIGGVVVEPGATWRQPPVNLLFVVTVRCDAVNPAQYSAIVGVLDRKLFEVGPFDSHDAAASAARQEIGDRFARLFADP